MTRYSRIIRLLLVLGTLALGSASTAWCDSYSITLITSGNGVYIYGILGPARFSQNESITFTGLSGVTGASVSGIAQDFFVVQSFTSTSVTFAQLNFSIASISNASDLIIDSTAPLGTVNWSGTAFGTPNSGSVAGPGGSAVPEPSSLMLLGAGALGFFGPIRRKLLPHWKR